MTFQGKGLDRLSVGRTSPWTLVDRSGEEGWIWWNRDSGELGSPLEGPQALVTQASDGTAFWLADGSLYQVAAGETEAKAGPKIDAADVAEMSLSISGELLALRVPGGVEVVAPESGESVWKHEGEVLAAGWAGDRLVMIEGGAVFEVNTRLDEKRELGALPEVAESTWQVVTGGNLIARHEGMVTLVSPALLQSERGVNYPIVTMPDGVTSLAFLDEQRWLALHPDSLWVFEGDRGLPVTGDLVDGPELWQKAQLSNAPDRPMPPTPEPPRPPSEGGPGGAEGQGAAPGGGTPTPGAGGPPPGGGQGPGRGAGGQGPPPAQQ